MRRAIVVIGMAVGLVIPSGAAFAYTVHESGSVGAGGCDLYYDSGTYSWDPLWGPVYADGPNATYDC